MLGQFMVLDPDMPWLCRADGHFQFLSRKVQVFEQLFRRDVAAQQHLVAHHSPNNVGAFDGGFQEELHVGLVPFYIGIDPHPEGHVDPVLLGQFGDSYQHVLYRIGTNGMRFSLQQRQIALDLAFSRVDPLQGALTGLKG